MSDYKAAQRPDWLKELCRLGEHRDLTGSDIASINQGGCESGAFMPAVTYWVAKEVFVSHGDEMLNWIESASSADDRTIWAGLTLADLAKGQMSVGGLACRVCSTAVELWCAQFEGDWEDDG